MPHSFGYRARTRDLFCKAKGEQGKINQTRYLRLFKLGQYVDIKADGAVHKGMPHKFYHGKTGVVWNITPRAVGVLVNKRVRGNIMAKKIHVRIEHARPSKCQDDLKQRIKANREAINLWKKSGGKKPETKRQPKGTREGHIVDLTKSKLQVLSAEPYISFYV